MSYKTGNPNLNITAGAGETGSTASATQRSSKPCDQRDSTYDEVVDCWASIDNWHDSNPTPAWLFFELQI